MPIGYNNDFSLALMSKKFQISKTFLHLFCVLLVGLILLKFAHYSQERYAGARGFTLDDSFIHLAVAKSIIQFGTYGINGEFVSVSTSPLWSLLITPLVFFFSYNPEVFHSVSVICAVLTAYLIFRLSLEITERDLVSLLASIGYLIFPLSIWGIVSGLEIHFANLLMMASLYSFHKNKSSIFTGLLVGLAGAARPENFLLAPVFLFTSKENDVRFALWFVIGFSFVFIPYATLNFLSHSQFFPTPSYAKTTLRGVGLLACFENHPKLDCIWKTLVLDSIKQIRAFLDYITIDPVWGILGLCGVISGLSNSKIAVRTLSVFVVVTVLAFGVFAPSFKLANYNGRYFAVFLPSIFTLGAYCCKLLEVRTLLLFTLSVIFFLINSKTITWRIGASTESTNSLYVKMPVWVAENIPKDKIIAANDIGGLAFFTDNKIVDLMGLASPKIWRFRKDKLRHFKDPDLEHIINELLRKNNVHYAILNLRRYKFVRKSPCYRELSIWREKFNHGRLISPIGVYEFICREDKM
ncbi:MAG: hypothetical protein NZO16_05350 [Deltaproteobacteria bacterium]|nr:hypothetical protein [Deltaproteobacteria bacterium]